MRNAMDLNALAKQIFEANKAKGFHNEEKETGTYLMLMVSELGEALEADRNKNYANIPAFNEALAKDLGLGQEQFNELYSDAFKTHMKDTLEDEMADALIRILDYCGLKGINIEAHVAAKRQFNKLRPHKHGKAY
jgi:NTP pyrophosphatase (non-canonical NTP hydrolase)